MFSSYFDHEISFRFLICAGFGLRPPPFMHAFSWNILAVIKKKAAKKIILRFVFIAVFKELIA